MPTAKQSPVRRKLDRGIETHRSRISGLVDETLDSQEERLTNALVRAHLPPAVGRSPRLGKLVRSIHREHRTVVEAQVPLVGEDAGEPTAVRIVIGVRVPLLDQRLAAAAIPCPGPRLVRPAEEKRQRRLTPCKNLVEWLLEHSPTVEPVVVVAERLDAVGRRHVGLGLPGLGHSQVVEAEIGGDQWLPVATKEWLGAPHVLPLGESRSPGTIVLGDRVELREVKGDRRRHVARSSGHDAGQRTQVGREQLTAQSLDEAPDAR